jgi:5'-nucleotidase
VTNDDGVESAGLETLAEAAQAAGLEVTVVAPCWDSSGSSASLTAVADDGLVPVERATLPSSWSPGIRVLGVHGAPAFIVRAAIFGAFGPAPDVVLSGVNRGANTGRAVLHSGTVGAALTAATHGRRALAISADIGESDRWDTAAGLAHQAVDWLINAPEGAVLNVNIPDRPLPDLCGVLATTLAPVGTVQSSVSEVSYGFVPTTFADLEDPAAPGTDAAAVADGYVSVTAIRSVTDDWSVDVGSLVR